METEIRVGDVVRLKSGGPNMTVKYIEQKENGIEVCCQWFDKNRKYEDVFDASVLIKAGAGVAAISSPFCVMNQPRR